MILYKVTVIFFFTDRPDSVNLVSPPTCIKLLLFKTTDYIKYYSYQSPLLQNTFQHMSQATVQSTLIAVKLVPQQR